MMILRQLTEKHDWKLNDKKKDSYSLEERIVSRATFEKVRDEGT